MKKPESWLQLLFETAPGEAPRLAEALAHSGALSVSLEDGADDPVYEPATGETVLWPHTRVTGLYEPGTEVDVVLHRIGEQLGLGDLPGCRVRRLEDRDWTRVWLDRFRPMRFGDRLWVCPSGRPAPDPDAVTLFLDPGLAFGTGTHATTALCLDWLARHPPAGETVIDYGCGSGILALAAARLGADRVWAVDTDPQALAATRRNAHQNGLLDGITVLDPGRLPTLQADCLLANILAGPLIELAPRFAGLLRPGGRLVLSGILAPQTAEVAAAFEDDFTLTPPEYREGWARLDATRR